jgi:hypothetical protein
MSAMKKFSDSSGRMPLEVGSRFRLGSDRRGESDELTLETRFGSCSMPKGLA